MAGTEVFNAVITAVDEATSPLRKVTEQVKSLTTASNTAGKSIAKLEHPHTFAALSGHVTVLRGHFGELRTTIGEVGHGITEFLPMLGALAAAGSLVGLFEMTNHVAEARAKLAALADTIGVNVQQLQGFNLAAKLTDVPIESMQSGLEKLNKTIGTTQAGKNKDVAALFKHLHIDLSKVHSAADVLPRLADAFQHTSDTATKSRAAVALFGKAGQALIPMLDKGGAALEEFTRLSREVDYAPSKQENEGLEEFHKGWILMGAAVDGVVTAIGAKLAPVLAPVLEMAREWVVANRDWIAQGIADKVRQLADWIKAIPFHEVLAQTQEWIASIQTVGGHLGGMKAVLGALVLAMGSPLLLGIAAIVGLITTLSSALFSLGVALLANPIGLVLVGLVALGAAAYGLWSHWDGIKKGFEDLWDGVVQKFQWAWDYIKPIVGHITDAIETVERALGINPSATKGPASPSDPALGGSDAHSSPAGIDLLGFVPALPNPYQAAAGGMRSEAADTGAAQGEVKTVIEIRGLPPGSTVQSTASGIARPPEVNVGYSYPLPAM